ncbi:cysteine desulfurase-like protein [Chytridium lagenaria]|nr:cysteine desulfurase-like protein [Chytridium lagenaria]
MTATDDDSSSFRVEWARSRFPAIAASGPSDAFTFMDNAGGSAVLDTVAEKVKEYLVSRNVQLGASYRVSQESSALVKLGNEAGRKFINAEHLDEIVMGSSTTQLVENLARAMEPGMKRSHEIIITDTEHEANAGPFVRLAKRLGMKLRVWQANKKTLELDITDLKKLLTKNTRLVAMTHCSNILGTVNDVTAIAKLVHTIPGAEICVDGVAYAPHRAVDVQAFGVYGPHLSMLYTRRSAANKLSSLAHFFIHASDRPYSLQPGGQNFELSASLPYILSYIAEAGTGVSLSPTAATESERIRELLASISYEDIQAGYKKFTEQENKLSAILLGYLASKPDVYKVVGRPESGAGRVPTISFLVKGAKSEDVTLFVDKHNIGIRFGHFLIASLLDL